MKPGCPGLFNEGQKSARGWGRAIGPRDGQAEGKTNCRRERQADMLYASNTSSIKETPTFRLAAPAGCTQSRAGPASSSSTQHSRQHQAAKGCGTAAASQPGETHISEVLRLLPRTCTLLSNPLGCEVFQKQKVILLQSRKGRFRQPAGRTSGTTSNTASENSLAKG